MELIYSLPAKYRGKPLSERFREPDPRYGERDVLIQPVKICQSCGCGVQDASNKCTRCGEAKLRQAYWLSTCIYIRECRVNRWGCNIHFRSEKGFSTGPYDDE